MLLISSNINFIIMFVSEFTSQFWEKSMWDFTKMNMETMSHQNFQNYIWIIYLIKNNFMINLLLKNRNKKIKMIFYMNKKKIIILLQICIS